MTNTALITETSLYPLQARKRNRKGPFSNVQIYECWSDKSSRETEKAPSRPLAKRRTIPNERPGVISHPLRSSSAIDKGGHPHERWRREARGDRWGHPGPGVGNPLSARKSSGPINFQDTRQIRNQHRRWRECGSKINSAHVNERRPTGRKRTEGEEGVIAEGVKGRSKFIDQRPTDVPFNYNTLLADKSLTDLPPLRDGTQFGTETYFMRELCIMPFGPSFFISPFCVEPPPPFGGGGGGGGDAVPEMFCGSGGTY
ncbi:hypothetical protein GWI33_000143 [Rhynchophorus ferrugineus]|uniref:Uncharacterized protein n=1 Tax=Rhynchophorus ferrugineus TaxID=354439 RepID=A0A834MNU0_RHYFE|nr:hypothetical protein GWI33_000143 [Rhynchophorus ferrugineus]